MKNTLLIFSSLLLLSFTSCKSKAKAGTASQPASTEQPTVYKGVTNDSCAVEMAFGSPGSGIDLKAYDAVKAKIEAKKLKYSEKSIGREGETRICMPLTEIKGKEKSEFIEQLKKIAAEGQLVSVSIR
ncbi:MAG: hypothetical protein V4635_04365 [Bacteroidota bacterium]